MFVQFQSAGTLVALDRAISLLRGPPFRMVARHIMRSRATVFVVHRERNDAAGVRGHTVTELRESLRSLRRSGARFLSVRDLVAYGRRHREFPTDAVAFTIDDGFADQGRLARVFVEENVPVTMFLISNLLDGTGWPWNDRITLAVRLCGLPNAVVHLPDGDWQHTLSTPEDRVNATRSLRDRVKALSQDNVDDILSGLFRDLGVKVPVTPPDQHRPLTWEEARGLEDAGVEFGAHSVTHRIFSRLSDAEAHREIEESRLRLRDELRRPLDIFAWPIGRACDFTERDLRLAQAMNLEACFATDDDYATLSPEAGQASFHALCRFGLPTSHTNLLQYGSWIERAKQLARGRRSG